MHRSKCVFVPVVAFGILPPPLRHPCPVMLGVIRLAEKSSMRNLALSVSLLLLGAYLAWHGCHLRIDQHSGINFDANESGILGMLFIYLGLHFARDLCGIRVAKHCNDAA